MIPYNIQWKGQHPIIVDNNEDRINTPHSIGESAELAITSYLVFLTRGGKVEKTYFLIVQHAVESCPIPINLRDITKLPANIQKKWLKFCLKILKLLKIEMSIKLKIFLSDGK